MKKYLEFTDENSSKFWQIELATNADVFTVTFGKISTAGKSQTKTFNSPEKALEEAEKLIAEKLKKGYEGSKNTIYIQS